MKTGDDSHTLRTLDPAAPSAVRGAVSAERSLTAAGTLSRSRFRALWDPYARIGQLPVPAGVALVISLLLWSLSLESIDLRGMSDVGLITALPATYFAALVFLTASFALTLVVREITPLLWLQLGMLVLVLFGTPSFVEYGPRTQSAWRLAGITDYITQHHSVDRGIDAFFNWPGFFMLVSFITQAAGMSTPLALARWAPLFFNLAYAPALFLIFRGLAQSRRQVWIGLWLFFVGNWVGQDYLAPQAFGYLIYLSIIATVVAVFPARRRGSPLSEAAMPSTRARVGAVAFVLVLFAIVAPSHQLTPWLVTISVGMLVLVGHLPLRWLPVVMAVMAAAWVVFGAAPYLQGHFNTVAGPLGSLGSNVHQNLGSRLAGNGGHLFVVRLRSVYAGAVVVLAIIGSIRLRRSGWSIRAIVLLAFAPFLALGAQTYGGELLLRTYFFSLPFLAIAAAAALAPMYASASVAKRIAATTVLIGAAVVFLVTRYGNEKMDAFTKQEFAAVEALYARAGAGSVIVSANDNLPWKFEHYADYTYYNLGSSTVTGASVRDVVRMMARPPRAYLILTKSQSAQGQLFSGWPGDALGKLRSAVVRSGRFRILFENDDSILLALRKNHPRSR
jgi:hypothetical protein